MSTLRTVIMIAALAGSSLTTAQPEPKTVAGAPEAKAQQFVLFGTTYTFTREDADNSKFPRIVDSGKAV